MLRSTFKYTVPIWFGFCVALELFVFVMRYDKWYSPFFLVAGLWYVYLLWAYFAHNRKD